MSAQSRLNAAMREIVAVFLAEEGFSDAKAKPTFTRISEGLDLADMPDVAGVPGVYMAVSARRAHRLSVDLDAARREADAAGYPVAALVQTRERSVGEAFVILTLSDFVKLARTAMPVP